MTPLRSSPTKTGSSITDATAEPRPRPLEWLKSVFGLIETAVMHPLDLWRKDFASNMQLVAETSCTDGAY